MNARATIRIAFRTAKAAAAVAAALDPENEGYARARVEGSTLVVEASADDAGSLLHTLDDALASVSAAERVLED